MFFLKFFLESGIKINQKIHPLKPLWLTPSHCSLERRRGESASSHVLDREKENHSRCLCPPFEQCCREGKRRSGRREGGRDERCEVSHSCPAWGVRSAVLSSSSRHQPSVLVCHYFTSHGAHTHTLDLLFKAASISYLNRANRNGLGIVQWKTNHTFFCLGAKRKQNTLLFYR